MRSSFWTFARENPFLTFASFMLVLTTISEIAEKCVEHVR